MMYPRIVRVGVHTCIAAATALALGACASDGNLPRPNPAQQAQAEPEPPKSYEQHLLDGDDARTNGDVASAAWAYFRALRMRSADPLARERIGYLHLSGDVEQARAIFDRVVADNPDAAAAWVGRGLAELSQRKIGAAEASLSRALAIDSENEVAALALGVINDWKKDHPTARQFYTIALAANPQRPETHINLGISYMFTMEFQSAVDAFSRSIALDPTDPAAYNNLGLALGRLRRYDESLAAFRRTGNEAAAQNNEGYVHFLNGDYEQAIAHYEAALEHHPDNRLLIIRNLRAAEDALRAEQEPLPAQAPLAAPEQTAPLSGIIDPTAAPLVPPAGTETPAAAPPTGTTAPSESAPAPASPPASPAPSVPAAPAPGGPPSTETTSD